MSNFDLKKFLTENKLTRASTLREQEETYKYFDKEGTGGTAIGKADGKTIYALEDSDVYDTLFYAIESESDVQFITIETEGESLRTSEIMSQLGPNKSPKIAKLIKSDIDRELGEGDEMYEQADDERAKLDAMLKSMSTYSVGPLFVEHAPKFFDGDAEEAIYQVLENIQTELEEIEMELKGDLDEGKRKSKKPLAEVKKKVKLRAKKLNENRIQIIKADEDYAEFNYEGKLYKVSFDDGYEATENHGNFFSTGYVSGQDQFGNTWSMDAEADNGGVVDVHPETLEMY